MAYILIFVGVIMAAVGLALGYYGFHWPNHLAVLFLTLDSATFLFVGGMVCIGLGSAIRKLDARKPTY